MLLNTHPRSAEILRENQLPSRRSPRLRPGLATVELAVLAPFLVILTLGLVDFGRFSSTSISVNNAARGGAYYGATSLTAAQDQAGIRSAVLQDLGQVSSSDIKVTSSTGTDSQQYQQVSVTVSVAFRTLFGYPRSGITLTQQCQMRIRPK